MFSSKHQYSNRNPQSLYAPTGERKYLTERERAAFIKAANRQPDQIKLLCLVLVYSGCRLSEALALTPDSILTDENALLIRSLKKRGIIVHRRVPLPRTLITNLDRLAKPSERTRRKGSKTVTANRKQIPCHRRTRLFPWGRTQALHHIQLVMHKAHITGMRATARGLRHTFATHGILSGIPLHLIQRWLGHTRAETTAIYADILGNEERQLAEQMWRV